MDELLLNAFRDLNTLLCRMNEESESLSKSNPDLAWKLDVIGWKVSNAISEIHEEWEAAEDRKAENKNI
jgi:hypothetical protein